MRHGIALFAPALIAAASHAHAGPPQRHVLDNGATIVLMPVEGAEEVAMETFYRCGFLDEPAGMTQAAHLCEHLACHGATASFKPGESMAWLNERGMANAETLAAFTHYDYSGSAADLHEMLRVEGERLTSLVIDDAIIAQEAPRCYAEMANLEALPSAPVFKFALMAAHQSWRHGRDGALVKGGLEEVGVARLRAFHAERYGAGNLLVVVTGGFDAAAALESARATIGAAPARAEPTVEIDWALVPRRHEVAWDGAVTVVFVAFPPPAGASDRLALSIWGGLAAARMREQDAMGTLARAAGMTDSSVPVGPLPFLLFAVAAEGAGPEQLEEALLRQAAAEAGREPTAVDLMQVRAMAAQLGAPQPLSRVILDAAARQFRAQRPDLDESRARQTVLGTAALQAGMVEFLTGGDRAATIAGLRAIDAAALGALVRRTLDPQRAIVTILRPQGAE